MVSSFERHHCFSAQWVRKSFSNKVEGDNMLSQQERHNVLVQTLKLLDRYSRGKLSGLDPVPATMPVNGRKVRANKRFYGLKGFYSMRHSNNNS